MGDFDDFLAFILLMLGAAVVIKIIDDATKATRYECPNCRTVVNKGTSPCPKCGTPLRWF
jgi:rRNA maturation endonuclease Nob1